MILTLALSMLLSGAAALLFETLWFRLAGFSLGNSVWASSLVLAAFMGGLAAGNALATFLGPRVRRPLLAYSTLEVVVGTTGVLLVVGFPHLGELSLSLLRSVIDSPWLLNTARAALAFVAMLVPATAMGATLPLILRGAAGGDPEAPQASHAIARVFGRNLGLLYGLNTLGAVAGALLADLWLIPALGVRATGYAAASLNLLAAGLAAAVARSGGDRTRVSLSLRRLVGSGGALLLAASFLAGAVLLALEVVWFRFLLQFMNGTSRAFAVMLAVVLLGIGLGGLLGSVWISAREGSERFLPHLSCAAGVLCVAAYLYGYPMLGLFPRSYLLDTSRILLFSTAIVLPVCVVSGLVFTLLGTALRRQAPDEATATGALTLSNTFGAMTGALLSGFVLLPGLGLERSIHLLGAVYALVAWLAWRGLAQGRGGEGLAPKRLAVSALALLLCLALFPLSVVSRRYVDVVSQRFATHGRPVAFREGLTESLMVIRKERWGEPYYHLLLTNGFSMAASGYGGRRYMKMFAYWPIVFHPEPRSALLISYGLGATAKALTGLRSLETIDVVDISKDVLDLAPVIFPAPEESALEDPRVSVHVEDGRFFLLATERRFDIITAEPPPPKNAGVVNLYSREYFALVRARLAEGGISTHWLPVHQLEVHETKAVIRAFCDVFEDCSLWTGQNTHWMLVGTRNLKAPPRRERLEELWADPVVGAGLSDLGFETPELVACTFLADATHLRELTADSLPLVDDFPYRLGPLFVSPTSPFYREFMDPFAAKQRLANSAQVAELLGPELLERALRDFDQHVLWQRSVDLVAGRAPEARFEVLAATLAETSLRTPVLLLMDSDDRLQHLVDRARARGLDDREIDYQLGVRAMADRDYEAADVHLGRSQPSGVGADPVTYYRALAARLAGRQEHAAALVEAARAAHEEAESQGRSLPTGGFWEWWAADPTQRPPGDTR